MIVNIISLQTESMVCHANSVLPPGKPDSSSRIVAMSRARLGLFILGNAQDFRSQGSMWSTIVDMLEADESVGPQFPIQCYHHPDEIRYISEPGDLIRESPDGELRHISALNIECYLISNQEDVFVAVIHAWIAVIPVHTK